MLVLCEEDKVMSEDERESRVLCPLQSPATPDAASNKQQASNDDNHIVKSKQRNGLCEGRRVNINPTEIAILDGEGLN